jgi:hypothetical protein
MVSPPPANDETGAMGREIGSLQGIGLFVAIYRKKCKNCSNALAEVV